MKVNAYYGSTVKFDNWDITKTREFGYHFGVEDDNQSLQRVRGRGFLYEVDLTFNNPLRMKDALRWDLAAIAAKLEVPYGDIEKEARIRSRKNFSNLPVERNLMAAEILNDRGYDAIIYDNEGETGGNAIIIWNPEQIHVLKVERLERDPEGRGLALRSQMESTLRGLVREMCNSCK